MRRLRLVGVLLVAALLLVGPVHATTTTLATTTTTTSSTTTTLRMLDGARQTDGTLVRAGAGTTAASCLRFAIR